MRGDSGLLQDPRWERWAAAGGILFVVLSVVWAVLYASAPGSGDSDEEIVEWYADGGNRAKIWAAAIALMFAGLAFLWFLGSIRTALRTAEGAHGRLSALAFGGGIVLTAMLFAKNAAATAPAFSVTRGEGAPLDASSFRLFNALVHLFIYHELFAGAALILFTSVVALRTAVLPRWVATAGLGAAILIVASFWQEAVPLVLVLAWVLVVSVLLLRARTPAPNVSRASGS